MKKLLFKISGILSVAIILGLSLFLNGFILKKYEDLSSKNLPGDNLVISGKCIDRVSGKEEKFFQDQILVREVSFEEGKFNGTVRANGQEVTCTTNVIEKNLDSFQRHFARGTLFENHFKEAQDNGVELIPMGKIILDDTSVLSLRNQNLFLSGTCFQGKERVIVNNEPVSILNVERTGEDYHYEVFKFKDSRRLKCSHKETTYTKATIKEIEIIKLKSLPPDQLKGRWVLVTGMCSGVELTTGEEMTYSLVSSLAKLIEIKVNTSGSPLYAVIGLKKENQILTCGGRGGRFVINPYLGANSDEE